MPEKPGRVISGADVDLGGERELDVVLDLGELDLGLTDDLDVVGGHGLAVAGGADRVVDDLLEHGAATDTGLEELTGSLAGGGSRAGESGPRGP